MDEKINRQLSRRDLLRYGISFAAVSAISNNRVSALTRLGTTITPSQTVSKPNIVFILMEDSACDVPAHNYISRGCVAQQSSLVNLWNLVSFVALQFKKGHPRTSNCGWRGRSYRS